MESTVSGTPKVEAFPKKNIFGKVIGETRILPDGRRVFVSNAQLAVENAANLQGYLKGINAAKDAAAVIDPDIANKAVKAGQAGIKNIEEGANKIAAGNAQKDHGERQVEAAKFFGF